jgi:GPH family glycoside/pentoside/hexuronide:cation symporter
MSAHAIPAAEVITPQRRLPLALQILYGIGEIPITATMGLVGIYILLFYNSVMKLDGALAGFGVTAGLVVDALIDPYIGFRSDRSKRSLGRRQSYMLAGCLGMGPCFWALLSPPQHLGTWPLFTWLLISSLLFRLCFATYRIPYMSLGAELSTDYDERTRVIAVRSLIGLLGMGGAATLPVLLFLRAASGVDGKLQYAGYPKMGLAFGAVMTLCGLVAVFGTQSRRTFGEVRLAAIREEAGEFFQGMWLFFKNRDFRTLWLAFILCSLAVVVNFSLNVHFLKWYAGIEKARWLSAVQVAFYSGAGVGVAAWIWIAKRGEKRNFYAGSVFGLVTVLVLSSVLVGRGHLLGTGDPQWLIVGNAIAGLFASALWVLPFSMMADVVDEDELRSGMRREGACFGIMNFGEKLASGGGLLLSGLLLSRFVHLVPGTEVQSSSVIERIGISYGIVPGLLLVCAIALVMRFRLDRSTVLDIQRRLSERRVATSADEAVAGD